MTIFHVLTGLGVGGAERMVIELTQKMIGDGYRVRIVSLNNDTRILSQYPGIIPYVKVLGINKTPMSLLKGLIAFKGILQGENRVVLHAHMFHSLMFAIVAQVINKNIRIIFTSHNYGGFTFSRKIFLRLTKRQRVADVIFSEDQHVDLNAKRIVVIPNFAPPINGSEIKMDGILKDKEIITFGYLGRLVAEKNPLAIIDAFLSMDLARVKLVIGGAGPLEGNIRSTIKLRSAGDRIEFLGAIKDVSIFFRKIDVLVMASEWEGLPMVILEAGVRGIPVISTPVGAIPLLLGNGAGVLCTISELPNELIKAISRPDLIELCGQFLRSKVEAEYSMHSAIKKHVELYNSCF
jgi:glycosyltransferase involved in cell wall biosynthesis